MKHVTFSSEINQTFYIEKTCPSRNGSDWIRCSLDRQRFLNRINTFELLISHIFSESHRNIMYNYILLFNKK